VTESRINTRIEFHRGQIVEQTPKLPDLVAAVKIEIAEAIIEELQLLQNIVDAD